ncbi:hypothetical protein KIN20_001859 [Parelaphostrongylus tenuis]|uniref:Plus3 domain-containing protein n=1 Tax=Parelaphostrongylus tenuis TaxID=148309 RepID=A0AAD5QEY1_PARTN|nr:hypothetical protein KIN20_001859 [Parelaphostrongylus tenuis]
MSSSDYSSSGDDEKPKDSDDSGVSTKKHRKRPTRNTSNKAIIESAGSSDSENSDSDCGSANDGGRAANNRKRRGSSIKRGSTSNYAKKKRAVSEESDRGEMDDDLFADEEDRRQVMAMNEKDREQEIFNRMEQQEMRRTRKQIEEKLAAAKNASATGVDKKEKKEKRRREERKRINESDSDDGKLSSSRQHLSATKSKPVTGSDSESEADMAFHRPSEVHKKATQKNAMADLLAKRKDKENKAAKKAALSIDAVFGKDQSDGSSSSSSSSTSSASSRSSSRDSSPRRDEASEDDESKKETRREVETVSDLSRARISRYKIAKIVYAPFFAKTVIGCFVRVGLGGYGGKSKYRLSQVVDVVETNRVYTFENNKTNKGLKLKYGSDERIFRIEFVSNAEFGEEEFSEWRKVTKEECGSLPTMDHIEKKESDIKKAMNFNYTDEVIEYIVREKKKFSDKVKNFALTKGELIKQKEIAEQTGDHEAVRRLQQELEELDSRADRADKKRCADISAINWINQRNRNKMKEQFLSDKVEIDLGHQDDPFTRKKERMKVVSGTKGILTPNEVGTSTLASSVVPSQEKPSSSSCTPVSGQTVQPSKSASNLFDLHSSITKVDVEIDLAKFSRPTASRVDELLHLPSPRPTAPPPNSGTRPLSVEDYRRRKAAAAQAP